MAQIFKIVSMATRERHERKFLNWVFYTYIKKDNNYVNVINIGYGQYLTPIVIFGALRKVKVKVTQKGYTWRDLIKVYKHAKFNVCNHLYEWVHEWMKSNGQKTFRNLKYFIHILFHTIWSKQKCCLLLNETECQNSASVP